MPLDRMDAIGDLAEYGRRIARSGAHFEDAITGFYLGCLDHQRDDVGLRDGLTLADGKRSVFVSELLESGLHKSVPRYPPHRLENMPVTDTTAGYLNIHHPATGTRGIQHCVSFGIHAPWPQFISSPPSMVKLWPVT
jgi:hypothetical protein